MTWLFMTMGFMCVYFGGRLCYKHELQGGAWLMFTGVVFLQAAFKHFGVNLDDYIIPIVISWFALSFILFEIGMRKNPPQWKLDELKEKEMSTSGAE